MDITKILHTIANRRQIVLFGLDSDVSEEDRTAAKKAFDDVTELLQEMAKGGICKEDTQTV